MSAIVEVANIRPALKVFGEKTLYPDPGSVVSPLRTAGDNFRRFPAPGLLSPEPVNRPPLDLDWVTATLAVGASFALSDAARLAREHGIRHVVDLRVEACDDERVLRRHGIELLHLPTEDVCAIDEEKIEVGVAWVNARLDRGARVLVHCQHGIGRSALLALCVLVSRGQEPLEALGVAKDARGVLSPSPEQLAAFARFCGSVRERIGAAWRVPRFDAMASIAYRHLASRERAAPDAP